MMTLFDWINEITLIKRPWDTITEADKKSWNTYMIHRFLSMNSEYIELVNYIQLYYSLESKHVYKLYCDLLPKKKVYSPYIKVKKRDKSPYLDAVAFYYKISKKQAEEYISRISQSELDILMLSLGKPIKSNTHGKIKRRNARKNILKGGG